MSGSVLHVVAYAVVENQQLLTVRKKNTHKFMFPGGKFQPGENAKAAIQREVREELSCEIAPGTIELLGKYVTTAANEADTELVATVFQGDLIGTPTASNEIVELQWIPIMAEDYVIELAPLITDCILPQLRMS
ncbi:NUDIX domain-containing protein [Leptolyngbyaceae cyanobacterium CCMR0082]|uniref:NUDIX domain-containing protein n=1 Tax=Adonisia turfae CCMR0082 TaxID=2304604 RepID=A0A6M0S5I4_9CYAN|nr:NUDIX domain-containing protein [Leptothoe sp. LEGE 181152]NEZ63656.1 NUDIX domain-containing protein [Adonisia turfae CCMR0082]